MCVRSCVARSVVRNVAAVLLAVAIWVLPMLAEPRNPNTDWFVRAGAGVFVHYLNGLQNNAEQLHSLGKQTSWDQCVREFDTERFASLMKEIGAGYVVFTIMQISRHMIAPNATFDRISGYKPGQACATRDLVLDLHRSLSKRGIPLMLYYTGDGPRGDDRAGPAFGCSTPVSREFVTKWASVVEEYGIRYKDKVVGYWVDGMYPWIGYDDEKLGIMARALKAGNPRRIIALNRGVDPRVMSYTRHEDFTAGEQNRLYDIPVQRWLDGEQWHILSYLGRDWAQPGCMYSKAELADYLCEVSRRGGVVSLDAMVYRDGGMDRSQVELLKYAIGELRAKRPRRSVPPGNLAYKCPSRLLSLDGSRTLVPSGGPAGEARHGVDGNLQTIAQGANEWPWTYEVDLVDTVPLRRIKVTFGAGYATRVAIRVSPDGQNWTTVFEKDGHDGRPIEVEPGSVAARYIRVVGLKPDGPDQPGVQMSIAELEAYR